MVDPFVLVLVHGQASNQNTDKVHGYKCSIAHGGSFVVHSVLMWGATLTLLHH